MTLDNGHRTRTNRVDQWRAALAPRGAYDEVGYWRERATHAEAELALRAYTKATCSDCGGLLG